MSVEIRKSDIEIFNNNGISIDSIKNTINAYRKNGISDEEIQQKFNIKLQEFTNKQPQPTEQPKQEKEISTSDYVNGVARTAMEGLSMGATPFIAGGTNVLANYVAGNFESPKKLYQEGRKDYNLEQQQFKEAYPKTSTAYDLLGSLGSFAFSAPLKGATTAIKGVSKLPKAAQTVIGSMATMQPIAVSKTLKEANREDSTIGSIAKSLGTGELEAGAFGALFGMLNPLESTIVAKATKMTGIEKPFAKWLTEQTVGVGLEAPAVGAIPALSEGRLPTKEEMISGTLATAGFRGVGEVLAKGLPMARKAWTTLTKKQQAELKAEYEKAQEIKKIDIEIDNSNKRILDIKQAQGQVKKIKEEAQKTYKELQTKEYVLQYKIKETKNNINNLEIEKNKVSDNVLEQQSFDTRINKYKKYLENLETNRENARNKISSLEQEIDSYNNLIQGLNKQKQEISSLRRDIKLTKKVSNELPKTDLLKELRRYGADYANANKIDKETFKNARVFNKRSGIGDKPALWLKEHGYLDYNEPRTYAEEAELEDIANEMITKALSGEKVYKVEDLNKVARAEEAGYHLEKMEEDLANITENSSTFGREKIITDKIKLEKQNINQKKIPLRKERDIANAKIPEVRKTIKEIETDKNKIVEKDLRSIDSIENDITYNTNRINEIKNRRKELQKLIEDYKYTGAEGKRKQLIYLAKLLKEEKKELSYKNKWLLAEKNALIKGAKTRQPIIEATEEEVKAYLKDHPTTNEATAKKIIADAKTKQSVIEKNKPEQIGLVEKVKRIALAGVEKTQKFFNVLQPIYKNTENAELARGKKTPISERSENILEELKTGGQADVRANILSEELEPMIKKNKDLLQDADVYMQAKKKVDFTPKEATDLDRQIVNKASKEVKDFANKVYGANKQALELLHDSGRITDDFYNTLKERDYVPSQAENFNNLVSGEPIVGSIDNTVKKYGGEALFYRESTVASIAQIKRIQNFKLMQDAKKAYVRDAVDIGKARKVETIEPKNEQGIPYNPKNQIVVWNKGNAEIYEVPEEVAKIFNPKPKGEELGLAKTARRTLQGFKALTTGLPVSFAFGNIARDVLGSYASKYGKHITPALIADAEKVVLRSNALSQPELLEVKRAIGDRGTRASSQIKDKDITETINIVKKVDNGISSAFPKNSSGNKIMQVLSYTFQKAGKGISKFADKAWRGFLETASYLGDRSELLTRDIVWRSVLEGNAKNSTQLKEWIANPNNIPKEIRAEARREAREVSLNFTREMNPIIEIANRYFIPYLKPSILGGKRMLEIYTNPETASNAWRITANLGALQAAYNMGKLTQNEKDQYSQINNDIKASRFTFNKDGKIMYIPLNQELAPMIKMFANAIEQGYKNIKGQQDFKTTVSNFMDNSKEAMINGALNASLIGSAFSTGNAVPQAVKPFVEVSLNKNFYTKSNIENESMKTKPITERYTSTTSEASKKLSKLLPVLSPVQYEHLRKGLFSTTGKELTFYLDELRNITSPILKGKVKISDEKDNPLVRAFLPNLNTSYNQWAIDSKDILDRTEQSYNAFRNTRKSQLTEEEYKKYKRDTKIYNKISTSKQDLSELRQKRYKLIKKASEKADKLNAQVKDKTLTSKQADIIARTEEVLLIKKLNKLNEKEKNIYQKIIKADKKIPK